MPSIYGESYQLVRLTLKTHRLELRGDRNLLLERIYEARGAWSVSQSLHGTIRPRARVAAEHVRSDVWNPECGHCLINLLGRDRLGLAVAHSELLEDGGGLLCKFALRGFLGGREVVALVEALAKRSALRTGPPQTHLHAPICALSTGDSTLDQSQIHLHEILHIHPRPGVLALVSIERRTDRLDLLQKNWKVDRMLVARTTAESVDIGRADDGSLQLFGMLARSFQDDLVDMTMELAVWPIGDLLDVVDVGPDLGILLPDE